MTSTLSRDTLKRRQFDLDVQRVLDEEFSSTKRRKISSAILNATGTTTNADSGAKKCVPLSPTPQQPSDLRLNTDSAIEIRKWKSVGHYRLLAPIEENAFVFTAVDTRSNGRPVVCRRLDRSKYERMMQLAHRLSSFGPKPVSAEEEEENQRAYEQIFPPTSEVIMGQDGMYYYFEPKDCGSLHAYVVERKRLNEQECMVYFRQILRLLVYCHQRRVVLRDLKLRKFVFSDPERLNIRLDGMDELFVCEDKEDPDEDFISDRHGCPAYVGPEILDLSQKTYSGRAADMWSLGVLLYVVLFGRYPFYDVTPARLFAKIRHAQIQLADDTGVSVEARSLIRCLLRRDPNERPSALDILAHPWLQSKGAVVNQPKRSMGASYPVIQSTRGRTMMADRDEDHCVPTVDAGQSISRKRMNGKQVRRHIGTDEVPNQQ